MLFENFNSNEIKDYLRYNKKIIVPIGSIEQHGPHLPVGTDYFIADEISKVVSIESKTLRIPTIYTGMSQHHSKFVGTISMKPTMLIEYLKNILMCLIDQGFEQIVIMNSHNGNRASLKSALMDMNIKNENIRVKLINIWDIPIIDKVLNKAFGKERGQHAGPGETSVMLKIMPESINLNNCSEYLSNYSPVNCKDAISPESIKKMFPFGIFNGDPTLANSQIGEMLFNKIVECIVKEINNW